MDQFMEMMQRFNVFAAFGMTIMLTVVSALGAMIIGLIIAIMRVSPVKILRAAGAFYVNTIRNTPLTLIVFFFAFGLFVKLGLRPVGSELAVENFFWGVVGLSVYHASFVAEALRSGVNTVPVGQAEAARSIGLTFGQSLRQVVLPQAIRGAISPLGNTLIALTKNTTVVATIGVSEASLIMKGMIEFYPNFLYIIFTIMATGFVVLTLPVGILFSRLSDKLAVAR